MREIFSTGFGIFGILAAAFLIFGIYCDPLLKYVARWCTARRLGNMAYRDTFDAFMDREEVNRVLERIRDSG